MRVVIHQPYFLPWMGFFAKLFYADYYVANDDVLFSKRHYLDRTKYISMDGAVKLLTLPVGEHFQSPVNDLYVYDQKIEQRMLRAIHCSYAKAEYFPSEWPNLEQIMIEAFGRSRQLTEINLFIIRQILTSLGLTDVKVLRATEFMPDFEGDATTRIISSCLRLGCDTIVIGDGGSLRTHEWDRITSEGIRVLKQTFHEDHPVYRQVRRQRMDFVPGVSIIDAILNIGLPDTRRLMASNIYEPNDITDSLMSSKEPV